MDKEVKDREVFIVMVFKPDRENPIGVSAQVLSGTDLDVKPILQQDANRKLRDAAVESAWLAAFEDVMWGEKSLPKLMVEDYIVRSSIRRRLVEWCGWRELRRVVTVPPAKAEA